MSILETFYLLFKADTSGLKTGLDESTKEAEKTVDKIGQKFGNLATKFAGFIASLASINAILSGIQKTVSYDINIGQQSRITGVSPEELDIWSNAVKQAGGTAEGFQNSLKSLAAHFHTTADVAVKALPQLADAFSRMNRYASFNYGKAIGLDEATILLLQKGRREVESVLEQQRKLGVITKEDTEVSKKYNNELGNLDHSFRTLYNAIVIPLLPALTTFFVVLQKGLGYLTEHKDLVVGAFIGIGAAAVIAAIAFLPFSLEVGLLTLAVILLIALFALLYEDLKVYFKDGKSLIGDFIKEWEKLSKIIEDKIDKWNEKFLKFLDKFKYLKPISDYLRRHKEGGIEEYFSEHGRKLIDFSSKTPLNNATSSGHFYESSFSKNSVINTGDIIVNTQATDAQGISKDIGLTIKDQFSHAANYFADGTLYG